MLKNNIIFNGYDIIRNINYNRNIILLCNINTYMGTLGYYNILFNVQMFY